MVRAVTKWNRERDRRLARLTSYIDFTAEYNQYCRVGGQVSDCKLGFFQDASVAGGLQDPKSTPGGMLCIFGDRTSAPTS